jgi:hypothetical protein
MLDTMQIYSGVDNIHLRWVPTLLWELYVLIDGTPMQSSRDLDVPAAYIGFTTFVALRYPSFFNDMKNIKQLDVGSYFRAILLDILQLATESSHLERYGQSTSICLI